MTKYFNVAAIAAVVLLAACAGNNGPEVDKSIMPVADSTNAINTTSPQAVDAAQLIQPTPDAATTGARTVATPTPTSTPVASGAGLNPAHGQPGHRCDIAVGAPLNSPPSSAATSAPVMQTNSAPTTISAPAATPVTTAPTTTAPGMNPPHGQPGHDCSIAVGAPLKKG